MKNAFSLVELSIVLVILGLLTGGILSGQNLIRAAELRSVTTDLQKYLTAVRAFQDKYFALPGDMPNAEDFWGTAAVADADCKDFESTGTETCNGNGDGTLAQWTRATESLRFWQHLANAGMIEGQYAGVYNTVPGQPGVKAGYNAPASKVGSGGVWTMEYLDPYDFGGRSLKYGHLRATHRRYSGWSESHSCGGIAKRDD